jgi:hypothetical protein
MRLNTQKTRFYIGKIVFFCVSSLTRINALPQKSADVMTQRKTKPRLTSPLPNPPKLHLV